MNVFFQLPFIAGLFSLVLAGASLVRRTPSPATWCFAAGMIALGVDSILTGFSIRATELTEAINWMAAASIVSRTRRFSRLPRNDQRSAVSPRPVR